MSSTLLATLRAATAEHHARTESLVPVLDPALGLREYAAILRRFRAAYEQFLSLWKDADSDIPILKEAKAEFARLR